jgi:hypothetical protein
MAVAIEGEIFQDAYLAPLDLSGGVGDRLQPA